MIDRNAGSNREQGVVRTKLEDSEGTRQSLDGDTRGMQKKDG